MLRLSHCRAALAEGDLASLADLMNRNFNLRRSIFGDDALGATNLHMISLARSVGGEFGHRHMFCFHLFVFLLLVLCCGVVSSSHAQLILSSQPPEE